MKKYLFLAMSVIFICSCDKDSCQCNSECKDFKDTFVVTIEEAEQELLAFMEKFEPATKGETGRTIESRFSKGGGGC